MSRLTPFGKLTRKHRIDAGLLLKDMADQVSRSAAFLSAVETGEKPIPAGLVDEVARCLGLKGEQVKALREAAEQSQRDYRITVGKDATDNQREVVAMFARQFNSLSKEDLDGVKKILLRRLG